MEIKTGDFLSIKIKRAYMLVQVIGMSATKLKVMRVRLADEDKLIGNPFWVFPKDVSNILRKVK